MIEVAITPRMRDEAAWAEQRVERSGKRKYSSYKLDANFRWYYGFLGELAFEFLLQANRLRYRYEPRFDGIPDATDFIIWTNNGQVTVDVKTCSKGNHRYLMLPTEQLTRHPQQVYVAVRIFDTDHAEVCGYAYPSDFEPITDMELKVPTSGVLITELRDAQHILVQCHKVMGLTQAEADAKEILDTVKQVEHEMAT